MKRLLAVFLIALCVLVTAALADSSDWSQYSDDDLRRLRDEISVELSIRTQKSSATDALVLAGELGEYYLEVLNVEKMLDYQDAPCLVVTYRFTNNSNTAATMLRTNPTLIHGVNPNDMGLEVKPGASITVQKGYILYDEVSAVDFEFILKSDTTVAPLQLTHLLHE